MGILREIFGPSKREIWEQVAREVDGDFEYGGIFRKDYLRVQYGEWEITLDTFESGGEHSQTYTRMRAPFVNKDGLRFELYNTNVFSPIARFFGTQDIEIKDEAFDKDFIIKGNDEEKIQLLFKDENIKETINYQGKIRFLIKDDEGWFGNTFPDGVDELYFECGWVIKNVDDLKNLFELFACTLERLLAIDSAYETDPEVKLN